MSKTKNSPSFEDALGELQKLVAAMESGDAPLTELVLAYEKGTALVHICEEHLKNAELKILQLKEGANTPEPFKLDS